MNGTQVNLSQSAKDILQDMDHLFEDDSCSEYSDAQEEPIVYPAQDVTNLITPPRKELIFNTTATDLGKMKKSSPGFSTATSPTNTFMTDKSKDSTEQNTQSIRSETKSRSTVEKSEKKKQRDRKQIVERKIRNPSGMVIGIDSVHTQFAQDEQAILDPTWLDSDEDSDDKEESTKDSVSNVQPSLPSHRQNTSIGNMSASIAGLSNWSTGSSISVGSCGLGKISLSSALSLSEISGSHDGRCSEMPHPYHERKRSSHPAPSSLMSHIDIVDMGIDTLSSGGSRKSGSSGRENLLDYLYGLDRIDYDLSDGDNYEDSENDESDDIDIDSDDDDDDDDDLSLGGKEFDDISYIENSVHGISVASGSMYFDDDDISESSRDQDDEQSEGLVREDLMSPPRLSRQIRSDEDNTAEAKISKQIEDDENYDAQPPVSPLASPITQTRHASTDDASCSDETDIFSNCSPGTPLNLFQQDSGLQNGDLIISILDCPGSRTRKKRSARHIQDHSLLWGGYAIKTSLSMARCIRKNDDSIETEELNHSSFTPTKPLRISNLGEKDENDKKKCSDIPLSPSTSGNKSLLSGSFSPGSVFTKSSHRSQKLEFIALQHLNNDDFDKALSAYRQLQEIYDDYYVYCAEEFQDSDEVQSHIGTILLNISFIYFCKLDYCRALEYANKAEKKFVLANGKREVDRSTINVYLGQIHYALGRFTDAFALWIPIITEMKKSKIQNDVLIELLNNCGCVLFETESELKSLKFFKEAMQLLQTNIAKIFYNDGVALRKTNLIKMAIIRSNMAYLHLRIKDEGRAIDLFQDSLLDQNICMKDDHELKSNTMENLAIALVKKGDKDEAIKVYSKLLTFKINNVGPEHPECVVVLTKLNLLQMNAKDKKGIRKCVQKIQQCLAESSPCEKDRFEKLIKVCKVSGLKKVTVSSRK